MVGEGVDIDIWEVFLDWNMKEHYKEEEHFGLKEHEGA